MGGLLSSISGQLAVRSVLLGTFFPVVLIAALNLVLVGPLLLPGSATAYVRNLAVGNDNWGALALTLILIGVTGILYNLNVLIIRLYEGYPWEHSFVGKQFKLSKAAKFRKAQALQAGLRSMARRLNSVAPPDPMANEVSDARMGLALLLNGKFPDNAELVLPTRLGNVIRNFERYPSLAYGMDAIAIWPRLISQIEASAANALDEVKISFDFMLHSSFLSLVTGLAVVTIGLGSHAPLSLNTVVPWLWRAALFFVLAWIFYEWTIGRAAAWGEHVKSAFDLYRFDLLAKLGYRQKPETVAEEKALWNMISVQFLYSFTLDSNDARAPYAYFDTSIQRPTNVRIEVSRKIESATGTKITVSVLLRNCDPVSATAEEVILVDAVPDGYKFTVGSASSSRGLCDVLALKPLKVRLGALEKDAINTVTYTAEPITNKDATDTVT